MNGARSIFMRKGYWHGSCRGCAAGGVFRDGVGAGRRIRGIEQ